MTRENAIRELKLFSGTTRIRFSANFWEALNTAIKALEQEPCEDAVSRAEVKKIAKEMYLEVANMELDVSTISDCISYTSSKCREVFERKLQELSSSVTQQEPSYNAVNSLVESKLKNPKAKNFDILHFVADNAGLSNFEAIEKAYHMGVSEQEAVLDKIRVEIAELQLIGYATVNGKREIASRAVMQTIDKYKVGSEGDK